MCGFIDCYWVLYYNQRNMALRTCSPRNSFVLFVTMTNHTYPKVTRESSILLLLKHLLRSAFVAIIMQFSRALDSESSGSFVNKLLCYGFLYQKPDYKRSDYQTKLNQDISEIKVWISRHKFAPWRHHFTTLTMEWTETRPIVIHHCFRLDRDSVMCKCSRISANEASKMPHIICWWCHYILSFFIFFSGIPYRITDNVNPFSRHLHDFKGRHNNGKLVLPFRGSFVIHKLTLNQVNKTDRSRTDPLFLGQDYTPFLIGC